MIEYAAELINTFKIVNKKSTPREALRGKHTLRRLAEFGENVLWLPEIWESSRMEKLESKFEKGIWLGVCPRTDEAIIGSCSGIVRAGTVKRQAIEEAWKSTSMLSVAVTPWTMARQSKHHELTVENDDAETLVKVDNRWPAIRGGSGSPEKTFRKLATRTVAWAATRCAHPSRPRGRVNIVDDEFKMILEVQKKVDKGSRRRRSDSRRPWSEQVRGLRVWECERQCVGTRKGLHRLQPRQEAVRRREPPVKGA
jgi:hypothetical protein